MKRLGLRLFIFLIVMMVAACGHSIEDETEKAEIQTEEALRNKPEQINETVGPVQFHLPSGLSVEEESPNNIILVKGTHPYVLFYNPNENSESEALYENTKQNADRIIVDKTFPDSDKFGYLLIIKADDSFYEITTGIGGIKATTKSTVDQVASDAEMMINIVASTKVNE